MKTADGQLHVIGGASRCGKTAWTKRAVEKRRRVFAWDPESQWAELRGWRKVTTKAELLAAAKRPGAAKIAFVSGGDLAADFDYWAGCVFYSTRFVEPTDAVAEELADVTTTAKAPKNWGVLLRRGLKRGGNIYALSQRWQEADKTAIGNASLFILFRQNGQTTARYLERMTGVPAAAIPSEPLQFITFDPTRGTVTPGRLTFR